MMALIGWQGECCKCKEPTWLCHDTYTVLRRSGAQFHCPNGHKQHFSAGPSEADELRKQLGNERIARQRAEQRVAQRDDEVREARERAQRERNRANGYKGHATRITKRAKAGVCPCCNRHFVALERHMASKHPQFTPIEIKEGEPA
jgi:hypothetical protein